MSVDMERTLAGMDAARRAGWAKFFMERRAAYELAEILVRWIACERANGDPDGLVIQIAVTELGFLAASQPAVEEAIEEALSLPECRSAAAHIREAIGYFKVAARGDSSG